LAPRDRPNCRDLTHSHHHSLLAPRLLAFLDDEPEKNPFFHDTVLSLGSVTLPQLEARINRFIAEGGTPPAHAAGQ